MCEHEQRQKQKARQKKKERMVRGSRNKNMYTLFFKPLVHPLTNYFLLSWPKYTINVLYMVLDNTLAALLVFRNTMFLKLVYKNVCVSYPLHFQRSYFPYLLRKVFCCPVTELPACPETSYSARGIYCCLSNTSALLFKIQQLTHLKIFISFGTLGLKSHVRWKK